jgi:hypothetical protein
MVLLATDELRHHANDDPLWRESLYFNFSDPTNEVGAWIYLWVLPNQSNKTGMLVSFYHGLNDRLDANAAAFAGPGHLLREDDGRWVYCFRGDAAELIDTDFDDVDFNGLHLVRKDPLSGYRITFDDGTGSQFELDGTFAMRPWDYADGAHPTPSWVATNRYHRSWKVRGELRLDGRTIDIDTTGDSDHSWGQRSGTEFSRHNFKMWSFQRPDGSASVSVIEQGDGLYLGFVDIDGELLSVQTIGQTSSYAPTGRQRDIHLEISDTGDRVVRATLDELFAVIGNGGVPNSTWGFEGVGTFDVDGWGPCSGLTSYFWPPTVTPVALHEGIQ